MRLDRLDHIPPRLLEIGVRELRQVFPNPTLIELAGTQPEPLFVCTLLHGNETSSFDVLQALARRYGSGSRPGRNLIIFIGNVEATESGRRHLDHQPDFNRIWAGGQTPYHALAEEVMAIARAREVWASIDVHNNTGTNPLYGCVNALRPADLQLAARFAPVGVYYRNPPTTQSMAFSRLCPAVTLECGRSGAADGIAAAIDLIEYALSLEAFNAHPPAKDQIQLFETVGRVVIQDDTAFAYAGTEAELQLASDLEAMNFRPLPAGWIWGRTSRADGGIKVLDEHGADLTDDFFAVDHGALRLTQPVTPAMITRDIDIIRQDCLGYLMKPI